METRSVRVVRAPHMPVVQTMQVQILSPGHMAGPSSWSRTPASQAGNTGSSPVPATSSRVFNTSDVCFRWLSHKNYPLRELRGLSELRSFARFDRGNVAIVGCVTI